MGEQLVNQDKPLEDITPKDPNAEEIKDGEDEEGEDVEVDEEKSDDESDDDDEQE
jgi:hypothetical protein